MIIAIDFDGTCVTHEYPEMGKDIGAVPVLKELIKKGHQLILFTMRSNIDFLPGDIYDKDIDPEPGHYLNEAINWFRENDIPLYGVNTNPTQQGWTHSPKAYANLYIDDAALGCPLKMDEQISERSFVDWKQVRKILKERWLI